MAKGYWVAHVDVRNADRYAHYAAALESVLRKFSGRYVVRGGRAEIMEGKSRSRNVIVEFPSYQAALDCYRSPEYASAIALRKPVTEVDLIVVEGFDGAQP